MLKVRGLKKNYGDFCLDVSLEVKKGYITGLIGRNGAGKSQLLRCMKGLKKPDTGRILIGGSEADEKTRMPSLGTLLMIYSPLSSVTARFVVPFTTTFAKGTGEPSSDEVTFPLTEICA